MAQKERTVKITLNGREVYGYPGQRLLDLCAECGVEVPALCYDPHISMYGGCSICLVEIEGARALARACATTINPGMVVRTDTERAKKTRKLGLELLLSDHVGDCRPPCTLTCPARGNVQAYINLAAQGKYSESLEVIHENVALPASIGRVCPAPCQEKCRRCLVDEEPVSIRDIKRFVADHCLEDRDTLAPIVSVEENGHSVAVVGGGPGGLAAAYYLRLRGYGVDLFDKEEFFGGMMRYGIPDYRLPPKVLQSEVDWILDHGVQPFPNTELGKDITLEELREKYDAVLLTMGCWKSSPMRSPGEDLPGVVGGIDFLYKVNRHEPVEVGKSVVVVGGGNTAMDACRCAKRLGAEKVTVIYRRTRAEMPAEQIEVEEAMEEGVDFVFLASPKEVQGTDKVEGVLCEKMELGEPDASGRRRPVPTGETFVVETDQVIAAIGQYMDPQGLPKTILDGKWIVADDNYATPLPGVFVAGDQKTGPDIAIAAIGTGHWAAESIHHYITKGYPKAPFEYDVTQELTAEDLADKEKTVRQHARHDAPEVRMGQDKIFEEYNHGLTEEQTLVDSARCMECGCPDLHECKLRKYSIDHEVEPARLAGEHLKGVQEINEYYIRNMDKCILCGRCIRACDELAGFHAIDFTKRGFAANVDTPYWGGIEASDCTQCGLCVQLCPVGALMEKRAPRMPHSETPSLTPSACAQCSVGCQIDLNTDMKNSRIVRITSDLDNPAAITGGVTCAKGRFNFTHLQENRLEAPRVKGEEVKWSEALNALGKDMKNLGKMGIVAGPGLSNEEYMALKRFGEEVAEGSLGIVGVDDFTPVRKAMKEIMGSTKTGATYGDLEDANAILLVEANLDEKQPALVSLLRRGMRKNHASVIFLGGTPGQAGRGDALILCPNKGKEEELLRGFASLALVAGGKKLPEGFTETTAQDVAKATGVEVATLEKAAKAFGTSRKTLTLLGAPGGTSSTMSESLAKFLVEAKQKRLIPLYEEANGAGAAEAATAPVATVIDQALSGTLKGLVLVGISREALGISGDKDLGFLVEISSFKGEGSAPYALPMANWTERNGTVTTLSGEILEQNKAITPKGVAAELCWILANLSRRLGTELPAAWASYSVR